MQPLGPLSGVLVLDFTQILAGPFCTQMLADAGASVVKVEPPGGELARTRGYRRTDERGEWITGPYAAVNRGKRSITLDLKHEEGLRLALRLANRADVIAENFAPGTLDRLGINFRALREARHELITCSISLFGSRESVGDLARRGGLAVIAEAESSFSSMQRHEDGTPVRLALPLGDTAAGLTAYAAIVTALFERERTGAGRHLDVSMVQSLLAHNATAIASEQIMPPEVPRENRMPAGWGIFPASDGYVAIAVNGDPLFERLARAIDQPWMIEDPRYATHSERDPRAAEVDTLVGAWTRSRTTAEIVATMTLNGVPCGTVATPKDIVEGDLAARLRLLETVEDTLGGTIKTPVSPHGFARPGRQTVPRVNEHAVEILSELLAVDDQEYAELAAAGAFGRS